MLQPVSHLKEKESKNTDAYELFLKVGIVSH